MRRTTCLAVGLAPVLGDGLFLKIAGSDLHHEIPTDELVDALLDNLANLRWIQLLHALASILRNLVSRQVWSNDREWTRL